MKEINGKKCNYYGEGCLWVCYDGKYAACLNKGTGAYDEMRIVSDSFGKKIVNSAWNKMVPLAEAVAMTCIPRPQAGVRYAIDFNDGDPDNCFYKNLHWVPYSYPTNRSIASTLAIFNSTCTVKKDGSVMIDGNAVKPMFYWKNKATGGHIVGDPFVYVNAADGIHHMRIGLDDIMRDCGYVQGDDAGLTSPVILHRDSDWMNFASSNLEWAEETDPRYQQYLSKKQIAQSKELKKLNG